MTQYVPTLEQISEQLSVYEDLTLIMESGGDISGWIKRKLDSIPTENIANFFRQTAETASNLEGRAKVAFITTLTAACLARVPSDISADAIRDPLSREAAAKEIGKHPNQNAEFLKMLAKRESSDDWRKAKRGVIAGHDGVKRNADYVGKYQFGYYAFQEIGKKPIPYDQFEKNPNMYPEHQQDADMLKLLSNNKHHLRRYLHVVGQNIGGIHITESGLLAAAHLVGPEGVKRFLDSHGKEDPKDGNGVPCTSYIKKFGGYKLKL